jgi:hypothetical protein
MTSYPTLLLFTPPDLRQIYRPVPVLLEVLSYDSDREPIQGDGTTGTKALKNNIWSLYEL